MLTSIYLKQREEKVSGAEALQVYGPSKEELVALSAGGDCSASLLLLLGMVTNGYRFRYEDFMDEDTGESVKKRKSERLVTPVFESAPGEIDELVSRILSQLPGVYEVVINMFWALFENDRERIPFSIVQELADRREDATALEWLGDYYTGIFTSDESFSVDKEKANQYYHRALFAGQDSCDILLDLRCLEYGIRKKFSSFEWYYDCEGFSWLREARHDYPQAFVGWTFDDFWMAAVEAVFASTFPTAVEIGLGGGYDEDEIIRCSIEEIKEELVSRGMSETAFTDYKRGVLVKMSNLSFFLVLDPEKEEASPESAVSVAPFFYEEGRKESPIYPFVEDISFSAKEYADAMFEMDKKVPDVQCATRLIYDKFMEGVNELLEEREGNGGRLSEVKGFLKDMLGGSIPDKVSQISLSYNHGWTDKPQCCHRTVYLGVPNNYSLDIDYDSLTRIPKLFFDWYVKNWLCPEEEKYLYDIYFWELSVRVVMDREEEILVIESRSSIRTERIPLNGINEEQLDRLLVF